MTIDDFRFPTWDEFSEHNQYFLDNKEYKGYCISIPATEALYLLIDCQNEHCIWSNADNVIRVAWCNKAGFAIASASYKYCEEGYLAACVYLVNTAYELSKFFDVFARRHVTDINARVAYYESEHSHDE